VEHAVPIAIGLLLLAVAWACWSGRWRAWSRIAVFPLMPLTMLPAVGVMFVAMGGGGLLPSPLEGILYGIATLVVLAAFVLVMWDPKWYGPAWYRERDATYDLSVPINAAIAASVRTTPTITSERAARARPYLGRTGAPH
jgi:hypothetical protein